LIIPLSVAVLAAITLILQKFILSYQKVNYKDFNIFVFAFLFLISAVFFPKFGWIKPDALSFYYISIAVLMIIFASLWNILLSQALQKEKVIEFELIQMLQPLATILLASLIFASERSVYILPAAIIASLALIVAHLKKNHLYFDKYSKYLLWAVLIMSVETIFNKILLAVYSPVALYTLRTFWVTILMWLILRPNFRTVNLKNGLTMIATAGLAVFQMVLFYSAIQSEGLIFTTLILILSPILVYIFSIFVYKEKLIFRTALAFTIIIFCIVFASLMEHR